MNNDIQYRWFAIYTRSRAEKKVYEELLQNGFEAYLPMRKELRQWSDRKKWVDVPIINSYIFVHIRLDYYRILFDMKGVIGYVKHKGSAVMIPDIEIEIMKRTVASKLSFNVEPGAIRKGQHVTIGSGPLKGITGEVKEVQGTKKFYMTLAHIGYTLVVTLDDEAMKDLE